MRITSGALAAVLLAGIGWSVSAQAQGVPQGTYLNSCTNVGLQGGSLVATCRRGDGREQRNSLAGVGRCVGDIGNNNGVLQCNDAKGGQMRGQVMAEPGRDREPGPGPRPGPGYGQPAYGAPPPGWDQRRWERCHELHERTEELRGRLDREFNPLERANMEGRLRELREQEDRCR
jgi:hypothetical protein